jgi:hypothetical protein
MADESPRTGHTECVPCQIAVYYRKNGRDRFCFSHIRESTLTKRFPQSLSVRDLSHCESFRKFNEQTYKSSPILILVTGGRAETVSYLSRISNKRVFSKYDQRELEGLTEEHRLKKTFSELDKGYMPMSVQCTVACYERGAAKDWRITNVIPMLSDWIIIPRIIFHFSQVDVILKSYVRAAKKCLADSRFLAEGQRFREINLSEITSQRIEYSPIATKEKDQVLCENAKSPAGSCD